jgi:hypothetical protein
MDDNLFFKILNEKHRDLVETGNLQITQPQGRNIPSWFRLLNI